MEIPTHYEFKKEAKCLEKPKNSTSLPSHFELQKDILNQGRKPV
jgi:hypothetical protein